MSGQQRIIIAISQVLHRINKPQHIYTR